MDIEAALNDALPSSDPMDAPEFDVVAFINTKFPNAQSLSKLDECMGELRSEIQSIDEEILLSVRSQAKSYTRAQRDLVRGRHAIKDLTERIASMHRLASDSESLVNEISRDVKTLDTGKRNITATITALKRLLMLTSALDKLRFYAAERRYAEAAQLALAINQLEVLFDSLRDSPKVQALLSQKLSIYAELQQQILEDFDAIFDPDQDMIPNLSDACLCVDAISNQIRMDIIITFCLKVLEPYKKIFQPPEEESNLNSIERRYAWFKRSIRDMEKYNSIFPVHWKIQRNFAEHFCHITRQHLVEVLGNVHHTANTQLLVRVLQSSIEFENSLVQRYEDDTVEDALEEIEHRSQPKPPVSSIPEKYRYGDALKSRMSETGTEPTTPRKQDKDPPRFNGIISECFTTYLGSWVLHEESQILETLNNCTKPSVDKVIAAHTASGEDSAFSTTTPHQGGLNSDDDGEDEGSLDIPRLVYSSASEVFAAFKRTLMRCSTISTSNTLLDIASAFQRSLRRYITILTDRLPRITPSAILSADQLQVAMCVVGTVEYCSTTLPCLVDAILEILDDSLADNLNFDSEKEGFWTLRSSCINLLVIHCQARLQPCLSVMESKDWFGLTEVGDNSTYVIEIVEHLQDMFPSIAKTLSSSLFKFLCDKFVQSFTQKFRQHIFACAPIGEAGAQQLLLDVYCLKNALLDLPNTFYKERRRTTSSTAFAKYIVREVGHLEVLLKVLSSTVMLMESYLSLMRQIGLEGTSKEFRQLQSLRCRRGDATTPVSANTGQYSTNTMRTSSEDGHTAGTHMYQSTAGVSNSTRRAVPPPPHHTHNAPPSTALSTAVVNSSNRAVQQQYNTQASKLSAGATSSVGAFSYPHSHEVLTNSNSADALGFPAGVAPAATNSAGADPSACAAGSGTTKFGLDLPSFSGIGDTVLQGLRATEELFGRLQ
eukprot:Lankesteria_metandrocarpae@DN10317_c0_g1_i1.p1